MNLIFKYVIYAIHNVQKVKQNNALLYKLLHYKEIKIQKKVQCYYCVYIFNIAVQTYKMCLQKELKIALCLNMSVNFELIYCKKLEYVNLKINNSVKFLKY